MDPVVDIAVQKLQIYQVSNIFSIWKIHFLTMDSCFAYRCYTFKDVLINAHLIQVV